MNYMKILVYSKKIVVVLSILSDLFSNLRIKTRKYRIEILYQDGEYKYGAAKYDFFVFKRPYNMTFDSYDEVIDFIRKQMKADGMVNLPVRERGDS